ncbi:MAG TPA: acetolactate synthase catalytic subunit [Xanthobacteraceae bacterium]|nr:acetolactate synthase catalytic subunit [Xanthobacteraceae bacterium]
MPEVAEQTTMRVHRTANQTVAQRLVATLKRHGIEFMVGQSIPSPVFLSGTDSGIRQILVRTEKAGAMIADGYARVSGKVPVVGSLGGPGTPLMMAGMSEAYYASIPMVALFQVVPRPFKDRNFSQDFDDLAALRTVAKFVQLVDRADRIDDYIDQAFVIAASGRPGPVALLFPPDLLDAAAEAADERSNVYGSYPLDRVVADPAAIKAAAEVLAKSKKPLIVAGGGVHSSQAVPELAWFQDVAGFPVATTLMGKGSVADTHSLSVGIVGYVMGRYAPSYYVKSLVDEADVIFLIGTRTNQNGTNGWKVFPRSAKFIHLDIDCREVGRNYEALRLVGDAKLTLAALRTELEKLDLSGVKRGRADREQIIKDGRSTRAKDVKKLVTSEQSPIRPERVMAELQKFITPETLVCADASYATVWVGTYIDSLKAGMRFITPRGQAGIGWGFPIALGVALASPGKQVVNVSGDGGFGYAWSEMETAVRHNISLVQIVLNNSVFGYQQQAEDASYGRHTKGLHIAPVDHAQIARACGWHAERVTKASDLAAAMKKAFGCGKPALVEVISDPNAWPPIQNFEGRLPATFNG